MTDKIYIQFTDTSTGEIIFQDQKVRTFGINGKFSADEYLTRMLECFKRGLKKNPSMQMTIECSEFRVPQTLSIF